MSEKSPEKKPRKKRCQPIIPANRSRRAEIKKKKSKKRRSAFSEAQRLEAVERRREVVRLRKTRLSFEEIAEQIKGKYKHCSVTTVKNDYYSFLEIAAAADKRHAKLFVADEIAVLDDQQLRAYRLQLMFKDNPEFFVKLSQIIIAISKERSKLRGNYKPQELKILTNEEFAAALGVPVGSLPLPHGADAENSDPDDVLFD